MKSIAIFVLSFLMCASVALAQLPTGIILGQVKDSTGAAVAGARITARNIDTNQARTAVSNDEGAYRLDGMPVGNYQITTEKEGFRSIVQSGLTLSVAQEASVNFSLEVGATSQTVEVTAEAPLVSTTTSSLGGLVDDQRMAELPLNGRNYNDLTLMQPGVTASTTSNSTSIGWSGTQYSSNGAPIRSNNYMLDGAILTNLIGTSGASAIGTTLGVDGILEYRVITNSSPAEYGMTMGSQMLVVSKSGSNAFHGDVFEFLRNSALDARNFFELPPAKLGRRLPPFRRNNFGGSVGGPIRKDKTFFFVVYEGLRQALGTTNTLNTLAAGCHGNAGDSIWNGSTGNGTTQPIGSIGNCPQLGGTSASATTIAAVMAPFIALYPLPNIPGTTQYGFVFSQPTTEDYGQIRIDHTISNNDSLFGRFTIDQSNQPSVGPLNLSQTVLDSRDQFLTLAENHIISTALLNSARASFSRTPLRLENPILDPRLNLPQYQFVPGLNPGPISVGGLSGGGTPLAPRQFRQNLFTVSDDLVYTRGNHSLKFGIIFNHFQDYILTRGVDKGQAAFTSVATFFTGALSNFTEVLPGGREDRTLHFNTFGFYGQDSWRVTPRLTLNLGLRYEPITSFNEIYGIQSSIHNYLTDTNVTLGPYFKNPSKKNLGPRVGFAWDVFGDGKTAIRGGFGILYDLNTYGSELMNSAGYDSPFSTNYVTPTGNGGTLTVPYVIPPANLPILPSYRGIAYNISQSHLLSYNLAVERQLPGSMSLSVAYAGSRGINLLQLREGNPLLPNGIVSGGVCTAQPKGTVINYASQYDGSATSCFVSLTPAQVTAGTFIPLARRNPAFASIVYDPTDGNSFYNSLQVSLNKRMSKGLQFQGSYTWARTIDNTQGGAGQDVSDFGNNMLALTDRAPSSFDVAHNFRFNAIYHLPNITSSISVIGKLVNGWWASGILALQTGYPFNILTSSPRSLNGQFVGFGGASYDHPDLIAGRNNGNITHGTSTGCGTGALAIPAGTPLGTPTLYYDPCAFSIQPLGLLGNLPRNFLRGPGLNSLDFSLVKDTKLGFLGEAGNIQFRAEFFNIMNRANFAQPNTSATVGSCSGSSTPSPLACAPTLPNPANFIQTPSSTAGVITTASRSRQIQFGLKIVF